MSAPVAAVLKEEGATRSLLGRAFSVLDACGEAEGDLTLSQIARTCGLPKSSAHRIVAQLVEWGGLERHGDVFRLGTRMFVLGASSHHARRLRERALPFLEELYERTHETVHLGVLDGLHVLYVDKLCGRRLQPAEVPTRVGGRMPLVSTGLGKAILATGPPELVQSVITGGWERRTPRTLACADDLVRELATIRRLGVAFDHEESHAGVSCVAAPIVTEGRSPAAAISVTAPTERFDPEAVVRTTKLCALAISRVLSRA